MISDRKYVFARGLKTRGVSRRVGRPAARVALTGLLAVGLSGCTDWAGYDLDYFWGNFDALSTMRGSVAYDPYELPRLPAEHTIPVSSPMGDIPPRFPQTQLDSAAATLTSPFGGSPGADVTRRGRIVYERQCAVCHGPSGGGNGPIVGAGKYPMAPAINIPSTAAHSDGYLYAIIVAGRGLMPPYGERMNQTDRWAVVAYVRELQRQGGAAPAGVPGVPTVVNPPDTLPGGAPTGEESGRTGDPR